MDENHILRRLQPKSMWYLSILGTLATTQREYVALHAFRRLNVQVVLQGHTQDFISSDSDSVDSFKSGKESELYLFNG